MSCPTEKPLARAASHLALAQYAEAAGAYRAVLSIDPQEHRAYLGLADCAVGRGRFDEAIEELVGTAQDFAERGALQPAFALMTKALAVDPRRLELHIDVAELEASAGRLDMAVARLHNLARAYKDTGQQEEAEAVLEAAAAFQAMAAPEPDVADLEAADAGLEDDTDAAEVDSAASEPTPVAAMSRTEPTPQVITTHPAPVISLSGPVSEDFAREWTDGTMPGTPAPVRTGDTFIGLAPRAEQSVARTRNRGAARRRASTIQMKALTAEIPKPTAVPGRVETGRTLSIVNARPTAPSRKPPAAPRTPPATSQKPPKAIAFKPVNPPKRTALKLAALPAPKAKAPAEALPRLTVTRPAKTRPARVPSRAAKPSAATKRASVAPTAATARGRSAPGPTAAHKATATPAAAPTKPATAPRRRAENNAGPSVAGKPPQPPAQRDGESLADRLRRQSRRKPARRQLAAKVKNISAYEKSRAKGEIFEDQATTLWCPEKLLLEGKSA